MVSPNEAFLAHLFSLSFAVFCTTAARDPQRRQLVTELYTRDQATLDPESAMLRHQIDLLLLTFRVLQPRCT